MVTAKTNKKAMELWRKGKLVLGEYLVQFLTHVGSSVEHSAPCIFNKPGDYISSKERLGACGDTPVFCLNCYCKRVKQVNNSTVFR